MRPKLDQPTTKLKTDQIIVRSVETTGDGRIKRNHVHYDVIDSGDCKLMRALAGSDTSVVGAVYYDTIDRRQVCFMGGKFWDLKTWLG